MLLIFTIPFDAVSVGLIKGYVDFSSRIIKSYILNFELHFKSKTLSVHQSIWANERNYPCAYSILEKAYLMMVHIHWAMPVLKGSRFSTLQFVA